MNSLLNFNWASWSDFLAMGGYGLYVWGSFGVSAVVMAGEVIALRARRATLRHIGEAPEEATEHRIGESSS